MQLPPSAVVVGAGLSGLGAAHHLAAANVPFLLLDASDAVGGRARTDVAFFPDAGGRFVLDRGFQILLTAYPECRRILNLDSLRLRRFIPGALVFSGEQRRLHRLADPFRRPADIVPSLLAPVGTVADKLRIAVARITAAVSSDEGILTSPETTIMERLKSSGYSDGMIDGFLRPFFAGIFFDGELSTSSRMFDIVFKRLALGDNAIPESGIGAVAAQLAGGLPPGSIKLNSRVAAVDPGGVTLDSGERVEAELGVIVAVEQPEAARLLPEVFPPTTGKTARGSTCIYFAAERPAVEEPILILNGSGEGIVNNMFFASNVSPAFAPAGKALVSVSLVGCGHGGSDEEVAGEVRRELGGWFGAAATAGWRHLRTYRIPFSQPEQSPPTMPVGRDPRVGEGVYVCGDHWSWATFDGALVAGRKAAEALIQDNGGARRR